MVSGHPRAPLNLVIRKGRARYMIPRYPVPKSALNSPLPPPPLPDAEKEAEFVRKTFAAERVEPHPMPLLKLLKGPAKFDLLHLACHGEAVPGGTARAEILLEGVLDAVTGGYSEETLSAIDVGQHSRLQGKDGTPPPGRPQRLPDRPHRVRPHASWWVRAVLHQKRRRRVRRGPLDDWRRAGA